MRTWSEVYNDECLLFFFRSTSFDFMSLFLTTL